MPCLLIELHLPILPAFAFSHETAAIADCIPASRPDRSAVASSRMERFPIGEKINWQIGEMVGAGAFGRVYLGLNNDTGQLMAVKQVQWHVC